MEIFFSISYRGVFVFRTDIFTDETSAKRAQLALAEAFTQDGYELTRSQRSATWYCKDIPTP